jgi:hypothetical protein
VPLRKPDTDSPPDPDPDPDPDPGEPVAGAPETDVIAAEIKALRKGRGVNSAELLERTGKHLRELARAATGNAVGSAIDSAIDSPRIRPALESALTRLAAELDQQMRDAVLASLGIHPATRGMPNFTSRNGWVAAHVFDRGPRQAERNIGKAEKLLAERVAIELATLRGRPAAGDDGWYVRKFSATVLLYGESPVAVERRRIVATRRDLDEIAVALDVPRDGDKRPLRPAAEVLAGGVLDSTDEPTPGRIWFKIRLDKTLQPGDEHEYEIAVRVPAGERVRPYYVFTPHRRCLEFELSVRFDTRRLPAWVRRVEHEDVRSYEVIAPREPLVPVDATGEVRVSFTTLHPQYGYGLQWAPA